MEVDTDPGMGVRGTGGVLIYRFTDLPIYRFIGLITILHIMHAKVQKMRKSLERSEKYIF